MKKKTLFLALISSALLAGGCTPAVTPDTPVDPEPVDPVDPVEEDYAISVVAPSGVSFTVDKERAKRGENVTLTITGVSEGLSIKDVTLNGTLVLTPAEDGVTYTFKMPNRSARIVIRIAVSGDVIIDGDFAAAFNETAPGSGLYKASVDVDASIGNKACFNIFVGETKLKALDLDESRSFGDIGILYGGNYVFQVATGSTYEFTYDSNLSEMPLYVQRTRVNVLPSTSDTLSSIMIVTNAVRSEPAMFADGLKEINYYVSDTSTQDVYKQRYHWKKYANNTTYATVKDELSEDEVEDQIVYRHYDEEAKTFTVVDTYAMNIGNAKVNDDRYRESYNNHGAYSARYDVVDGDDYRMRYAINESHVSRMLRSGAHQPAYLLDFDIHYAYRTGLSSDDEVSSYNVAIESTPKTDGFTTTIDTYVEYDSMSGTYTTDHHEAYVFDVDIDFDERGAVTSLEYRKKVYTQEQWDFANHKPLTGQTGTTRERISATYVYGEITETLTTFDESKYFISNFSKIQYVNKNFVDQAASGDSYLALDDALYLQKDDGSMKEEMTVEFEPTIALDLWQYSPTSSNDDTVITHKDTDLYYQMSPVNEGDAVVTFTNHVTSPSIQGATKDVNVHVRATKSVFYFYIYKPYSDGYSPVDAWNAATVNANGQYKFAIAATPSGSPLKYTAVSKDTSKLTVVSAPNSADLIIDTTGANGITKNVDVEVELISDRYDEGKENTVLIFTIMPAHASPIGKWNHIDSDEYPETYIEFTTEVYDGNKYKGQVVDVVYQNGVALGTNIFYFWYTYDGSHVNAGIYDISIGYPYGDSFTASDVFIDFTYDGKTGNYGLFLATYEMDSESESYYYFPFSFGGSVDETYMNITGYTRYVKEA